MTLLAAFSGIDIILMLPDALHAFLAVWLVFVGSCVGSFLNVVVFRMPAGMSISRTGSRCPICLHPIRWYDNIPLIGWMNLRGKCRDCGTAISSRYPCVEFLVAVVFLVLAFGEGFSGGDNLPQRDLSPLFQGSPGFEIWSTYVYHLVLIISLIAAGLIAYDRKRVPGKLYIPALVVGAVGAISLPQVRPVWSTLVAEMNQRVAGGFDMLIGAAIGALLGWLAFPMMIRRVGSRTSVFSEADGAAYNERWAVTLPVAVSGMFLGWQAISAIAVLTAVCTLIQLAAARLLPRLLRWPGEAYLAAFSALYILNWGRLVEQFPGLGTRGGLGIVVVAVILVPLLMGITRRVLSEETLRVLLDDDRSASDSGSPLELPWVTPADRMAFWDYMKDIRLVETNGITQVGDVMNLKKPDENLKAILASPSYLPVERDADFLTQPELRPVRLQLELQKPEIGFFRENVNSTIVVFGGTQIVPKDEAERRREQARQQLAKSPDDPKCQRELERVERVVAKTRYYDAARDFARLVSSECLVQGKCDYIITTGGGPGVMEAANRGAHDVGAKSIGLNISIPEEQAPNPYVAPNLCFQFHYFAIRKMHFLLRAKALVVFPGGFGTLDELFDALTLRQTRRMQEIPIILFGRDYWDQVVNWQFLADEGVVADNDLQLVSYAETAEEAWQIIKDYHAPADQQFDG